MIPHPRIAEIQAAVCAHYGLRRADMTSDARAWDVSHPRQLAMFLARATTPRSLFEIGRLFGGRDHTTVIHAVRAVECRLAEDYDLACDTIRIVQRVAANVAERAA